MIAFTPPCHHHPATDWKLPSFVPNPSKLNFIQQRRSFDKLKVCKLPNFKLLLFPDANKVHSNDILFHHRLTSIPSKRLAYSMIYWENWSSCCCEFHQSGPVSATWAEISGFCINEPLNGRERILDMEMETLLHSVADAKVVNDDNFVVSQDGESFVSENFTILK